MNFKFLHIEKTPGRELIELLKKNRIGTPGHGMIYQHLEVQKKIDHIEDPYFVNLIRRNTLIATCCFCSREALTIGKRINSFHIRYFSFKETYRTKQLVVKKKEGRGALRKELKSLLEGEGLQESSNNKFFHYAYIDPRNLRSAKLCKEFGFEPVRKFSTLIFNRMNPKEDKRVTVISTNEDVYEVKELLINFYKDFTMFSFENLFRSRKYYLLKDGTGQVLAGVQAEPDSWKIHQMPGILGKIILPAFSSLPFLKKIINKDYRFLTLEGVYYKPGHENYLEILFESLLARYKVNSAMLWVDTDTSLYHCLRKLNLGIVDKLNQEVKADVICKFINFEKKDINLFKEHPAYISGIDLT